MKKILIIDDDVISNLVHSRILQRSGIAQEIKVALNGRQALDILRFNSESSFLPDIILLDLMMPELDGFGFLEIFKGLKIPGLDITKIIAITSSGSESEVEKIKKSGVVKYLIKPVHPEDLISTLIKNSRQKEHFI